MMEYIKSIIMNPIIWIRELTTATELLDQSVYQYIVPDQNVLAHAVESWDRCLITSGSTVLTLKSSNNDRKFHKINSYNKKTILGLEMHLSRAPFVVRVVVNCREIRGGGVFYRCCRVIWCGDGVAVVCGDSWYTR